MSNQNLDWEGLYKSILALKETIKEDLELEFKKSREEAELERKKSREEAELERKKSREEWEIELKESNRKIDKVAKMIGNHTKNVGDVAEEFFYRGLAKTKRINNLKFDVVRRKDKNTKEYDIVMVNGDTVAVISVKFKLHAQDVEDFIKKDLPIFRKEFPEFRNYKLYAGIASMCVPDELEKQAEEAGLFVFTQSGDKPKLLNSVDFIPSLL